MYLLSFFILVSFILWFSVHFILIPFRCIYFRLYCTIGSVIIMFCLFIYPFCILCLLFIIYLILYPFLFDVFMLILYLIIICIYFLFYFILILFCSIHFILYFILILFFNKHVKTYQNADLTCYLNIPRRCQFQCRITFWNLLGLSLAKCIQ